MSEFVDRVTLHVKGGDGGNGAASIRREKFKPLAGPDGGNGGDGGSVIAVADSNATTLLDYSYMPHRIAQSGTMGLGDDKDGRQGADLILPVPVGTVIFEAPTKKQREDEARAKENGGADGEFTPRAHGKLLADLSHAGDRFVLAKGGQGGLGNRALSSKTRRAPGFALLGEPGEERDIVLELKSIADVALVGYPSAGKSSLIATMSAARPKIADYPFTTLVPNLGVVMAGHDRFTIADVPGLIPGAAQGKGLGLEFLRHIERTEVIAHVIDCATLDPDRDPISDYHALENELAQYAGSLDLPLGAIPIAERPRVIILNKIDIPEARELAEFVKPQFEDMGLTVMMISTATHEGLKELTFLLDAMVKELRAKIQESEAAREEEREVIHPLDMPNRRRRPGKDKGLGYDFEVERRQDSTGFWWEVTGDKPEQWVRQTNFDNDEAVGYLADRLAKLGVEKALRLRGAHIGDEVRIGRGDDAVSFDWDPTVAAGAEMLDGTPQSMRGTDIRLQDDGRAHRRTNAERRREYHEMMDARTAVRAAMAEERKAGHWADPAVNDDPNDEHGLLRRFDDTDWDGTEAYSDDDAASKTAQTADGADTAAQNAAPDEE